ncbi:carboxyl transferase domain-containing protein [Arthrobacter sp. NPDC090010]|uniref:carboxyl transferase domain-containing protein n=1 Tax=Arthrobacter sp. NPDC090010 TaxID=3363942 RepID=UPI00382C27D1
MPRGWDAGRFLDALADRDSIRVLDRPADYDGHDAGYRLELLEAASGSGCDEAVTTAEIRLDGHRLVVLASEFRFLGGSLGITAAQRLVAALEHATAHRLPVLALPSSGGTRMQEGTPAFLRMIDVVDAIHRHRSSGLPYLVHLRHPTTGGAFASWGSLGQLTTATPGALIGLLGPRVTEALNGAAFPHDIQTSENLHRHGILDALVEEEGLRDHLAAVLSCLVPGQDGNDSPASLPSDEQTAVDGPPDPWDCVLSTRAATRPGLQELFAATTSPVFLRGTGAGERDDSIAMALCRIAGRSCLIVGHDRSASTAPGPAALRGARRGIRLAGELGLPLITVVDTSGAELSARAENGALAGEVARCLGELRAATVPTATVLLGQGCGAAALALFSARHTIAAADAWLAPLPLEGASMIVHRDTGHAPQMAAQQGISAHQLARTGQVNRLLSGTGHETLIPQVMKELQLFLHQCSALTV